MCINKRKAMIKSGVTLIELIATLAILSIVLVAAYSISFFGSKSFNDDGIKSDIQTNLRDASQYITKEMRYCSNVTILDSVPSTFDTGKEYIYVNSDGVLMHCKGGVPTRLPASISSKVKAKLQFEKRDYETLYFKIPGEQGNQKYTLDSVVKLLNICDKVIYGPLNGVAVCYTPGKDLIDKRNTKAVKSIEISAAKDYMLVGEPELLLSANVLPADAPNKNIGWFVDDESLAIIEKIEPYGARLKPITTSAAVVKVYAVAMDDSGVVSQPYIVNIKDTVISETKYVINFNTDRVRKGTTVDLSFNVEPNALISNIKWELISGPGEITPPINTKTISLYAYKGTQGQKIKLRVSFYIDGKLYSKEQIINITS